MPYFNQFVKPAPYQKHFGARVFNKEYVMTPNDDLPTNDEQASEEGIVTGSIYPKFQGEFNSRFVTVSFYFSPEAGDEACSDFVAGVADLIQELNSKKKLRPRSRKRRKPKFGFGEELRRRRRQRGVRRIKRLNGSAP